LVAWRWGLIQQPICLAFTSTVPIAGTIPKSCSRAADPDVRSRAESNAGRRRVKRSPPLYPTQLDLHPPGSFDVERRDRPELRCPCDHFTHSLCALEFTRPDGQQEMTCWAAMIVTICESSDANEWSTVCGNDLGALSRAIARARIGSIFVGW